MMATLAVKRRGDFSSLQLQSKRRFVVWYFLEREKSIGKCYVNYQDAI